MNSISFGSPLQLKSTADVEGRGYWDGLSQEATPGAGNISDVLQEMFNSAVEGGNLRVGIPEVVN